MYNKIVNTMGIDDPTARVPFENMIWMLETRVSPLPDKDWGYLGDRKIL